MKQAGARAAIIAVLLVAVIVFGAIYYAWNTMTSIFQPVPGPSHTMSIEIQKGETTAQIGDDLVQKGLIRNALAFRIWARIKGLDTRLQAGMYNDLSTSMTISQIIDKLLDGQPNAIRVIIPEGWRLEQIGHRFATSGLVKFNEQDFLKYTKHIDLFPDKGKHPVLNDVPQGQNSMEGLLFPDSYLIPLDGTARDVVNIMLNGMEDKITQNHLDAAAKQHQMNVYQMITLASIVERETLAPEDRGNIASVYWNRLYKIPANDETRELLQADPTVQYARDTLNPPKAPNPYWAPLQDTGGQIAADSPWNTYTHQNFPPTPICSPGLASLKDAAAPPSTNYYYFFAKKDGHSVFASTLAEFETDKQKYEIRN
ncbi:endolytic transglycosylase MltG [Ktedonosporobacter rubrisoli]|uniref:Endolytic murein transglycosylase n=1 Tax=Ktedonosporobacter rubrisoli TaxID=2509675 RepID=A0A4P6JW87_KTERU|nr:endolytic transglycosylase MltG [Ktedonosporobacter rubrisoli]QBD79947.1 endolytic transglycosylase MltG [Ktedonosporobacter rubrisoli]